MLGQRFLLVPGSIQTVFIQIRVLQINIRVVRLLDNCPERSDDERIYVLFVINRLSMYTKLLIRSLSV